MKNMFTACYGRAKSIPPEYAQVRTSRGVPDWWKPIRRIDAMPLAPSQQVMAVAKAGGDWRGLYRKQLEALFERGVLQKVIDQLPENAVLLCFESDPRDCHRSILAAFLNEKGLAIVKEWQTPPPPPKPPKPTDPQLFLL